MDNADAMSALAALSQQTRLDVFRLLVQAGPTGLSVGEIAASVKSTPATLSFHLKELAHADLIVARQDGRYIFYSANYRQMDALIAYLMENCCARDCGAGARSCNKNAFPPTVRRNPAKPTPGRVARPSKRRAARGTVKT